MIPTRFAEYVDPTSVALGLLLSGLFQLVVSFFVAMPSPAAGVGIAVVGLICTTLSAGVYAFCLHSPDTEESR
jgi:hypothetical protein